MNDNKGKKNEQMDIPLEAWDVYYVWEVETKGNKTFRELRSKLIDNEIEEDKQINMPLEVWNEITKKLDIAEDNKIFQESYYKLIENKFERILIYFKDIAEIETIVPYLEIKMINDPKIVKGNIITEFEIKCLNSKYKININVETEQEEGIIITKVKHLIKRGELWTYYHIVPEKGFFADFSKLLFIVCKDKNKQLSYIFRIILEKCFVADDSIIWAYDMIPYCNYKTIISTLIDNIGMGEVYEELNKC